MKEKMKEFVEKHKTKIIVIGAGAAALTCGVIGYKLGKKEFETFKESIGCERFFNSLQAAIDCSDNYYVRTFGPEDIVKFKDIGTLAKEAIEFGASADHMEDNVVGMFVLTRPEG